ncbi:hypothetical protein HGRIS_012739 [Hohenbuehelia grisea]|uniref:DUF6533 domain-containing protein n=1 Tax=Hohenbuehelia grisea TaxID=104357 RepID=A0ABR3ITH8_9AGAR
MDARQLLQRAQPGLALNSLKYVDVATYALLLYDYGLTLDREVSLVWSSSWNATKIFFLLARYVPFVDAANAFYHNTSASISSEFCLMSYRSSGWLALASICICIVILSIRAWAVSGRQRLLTFGLPVYGSILWVIAVILLWMELNGMEFFTRERLSVGFHFYYGCLLSKAPGLLYILWIIMFMAEATLVILMLVRGFTMYRTGGFSAFLVGLYKDGFQYYVFVFAVSLLGIIASISFRKIVPILVLSMERVVHSVVGVRVILHIREQARFDPLDPEELTYTNRQDSGNPIYKV